MYLTYDDHIKCICMGCIMSAVLQIKAMDCDYLFEVTHDLGKYELKIQKMLISMRIRTNDF